MTAQQLASICKMAMDHLKAGDEEAAAKLIATIPKGQRRMVRDTLADVVAEKHAAEVNVVAAPWTKK